MTSSAMLTAWKNYHGDTLFAFQSIATGEPVAVAEASGARDAVNPGWWIAPSFREQGYGRELVCLLAERLKQNGYTGVRQHVLIDGNHREASAAILARFRRCFVA